MGPESKGRALLGKIYKKLETILVEVDTFTSQNTLCLNSTDPSGWGEPEEVAREDHSDLQQHHDRLALPSYDSSSAPPSHQNFDISASVFPSEKSVEQVRAKPFRDFVESFGTVVECNDDPVLSVALGISTNETNLNPTSTKIPDAPVQDNVANMRTSNEDGPDDVTKASSGMAFREDPLYVDNNALTAC